MAEPDDVLESLAELPTIAHPTVSSDGSKLAFYYDITGRNELHVYDFERGSTTQWSNGEVPRNARWFIDWDVTGEQVYFHLDDAGNEQNDIYSIDQSGSVDPVIELDGQTVLGDVGSERLLVGSTRDGQMNAYRFERDQQTIEKITDFDRAVGSLELSPQEDQFAFSTNETDDYDNQDVYIGDIDGSNVKNLEIGDVGAEAGVSDWSPEGDRLLVSDNTPDLPRIGVYDITEGTTEWLQDGEHVEYPTAFLPDGTRVLGTRVRDAETVPIVYDLKTGTSRELTLPEGVASFGRSPVVSDHKVLLSHTTPTTRPEVLVYDLQTDDYETVIEAEYGPFDPSDFADAKYFTVESDGIPQTPQAAVEHTPYEELDIGALLYDSGRRPSPLIVNPHGGPRARDSKRFDLYTQVLVSRGFSVLKINYRGSAGQGRSFVRSLHDDWGGAEQGDIAVVTEDVLKRHDWIDEDRVVVFGGSYGGYSTYWQLVQYPELYDAGVAWIGLTDLREMYETTMPHFRTELMKKYLGTPEENPELYRERSPITHATNLAAPLLMVHGVNDRRVPISQAELFREELLAAGYTEGPEGDFEYQELGEEGHGSSDQEQKLRMFRLLDEFLDRRLGTEPATAPGQL